MTMPNLAALTHQLADALIEAHELLQSSDQPGHVHFCHETFPAATAALYKLTDEVTALRLRELSLKMGLRAPPK